MMWWEWEWEEERMSEVVQVGLADGVNCYYCTFPDVWTICNVLDDAYCTNAGTVIEGVETGKWVDCMPEIYLYLTCAFFMGKGGE